MNGNDDFRPRGARKTHFPFIFCHFARLRRDIFLNFPFWCACGAPFPWIFRFWLACSTDFLSQLLSSKSGALRPKSQNGESNNIFSPNHLTPAALPTFSHKAYSFQLQVELPDKLGAFYSRRPKSPSTLVVF